MVEPNPNPNPNLDFYSEAGMVEEARQLYGEALRIASDAFGYGHTSYLGIVHNVATLLTDLGEEETALTIYHHDLTMAQRTLGVGHPAIADRLSHVAEVHRETLTLSITLTLTLNLTRTLNWRYTGN